MTELCNKLIEIVKAQKAEIERLKQREKDLMEVIRQEQVNCLNCSNSAFWEIEK